MSSRSLYQTSKYPSYNLDLRAFKICNENKQPNWTAAKTTSMCLKKNRLAAATDHTGMKT